MIFMAEDKIKKQFYYPCCQILSNFVNNHQIVIHNMNRYAIFSDIDGTLVSFKTHRVPESAVQALTEAHKRGHRLYISTGRPKCFIINLKQIEHLIDGYMTTNGAYCYIGKQEVYCRSICPKDVQTLLHFSDQLGFPCVVVGEKNVAVYHNTPEVNDIFYGQLGVPGLDKAPSIDALKGQRILQLTPFISPEVEKQIMPHLPHCNAGRWTPIFLDITDANADKGKGLLKMAEHEKIAISHTLTLGDGGNDIPIIKQAGIGIAMGNASEHTKEIADFVTHDVDDNGLAYALRHYGLI